ncbi:MAG: di-trans,poly-cis-decaprenylcistransferase [Thiotrichaceae bacterium]|nr:di-trans,poly-cis-decaprenylcistransferase [Thiotrichaceae bacterium]
MDGNGRWAKSRLMPRPFGHKKGVESVRRAVKFCVNNGVRYLTIFAFSSENWKRPKKEVSLLMSLLMKTLKKEALELQEQGVSVQIIGNRLGFSQDLQDTFDTIEQQTKEGSRLHLSIAANYGGRWDITQACQQLAKQVKEGGLEPEAITEKVIANTITSKGVPDPDLFIRTGGEVRISNFLMWQLAYTELYFCDTLWPDFDDKAFSLALQSYADRQRRFGKTGDQLTGDSNA